MLDVVKIDKFWFHTFMNEAILLNQSIEQLISMANLLNYKKEFISKNIYISIEKEQKEIILNFIVDDSTLLLQYVELKVYKNYHQNIFSMRKESNFYLAIQKALEFF